MADIKVGTGKGFRVKVEGFNEVLKTLSLTKDQTVNLQKFLKEEGHRIVKTARQIVPVKTGRLKDSHRVLTYGTTGKRGFVRVDIVAGGISVRGKFVNYAAAVHEGAPGMPGRPWLETAAKMHFNDARLLYNLKNSIKIYGSKK